MFKVFTRTWWRNNSSWPNGLEPCAGPKHTLAKNVQTEEKARSLCAVWNANHKPGRLSRKAEYMEQ